MFGDLRELLDKTCRTVSTTDDMGKYMDAVQKGGTLTKEEAEEVLMDLAMMRYHYTVNKVLKQTVEILSRSWYNGSEAISDLRQARKMLVWITKQVKEFGLEVGDIYDEGAEEAPNE